MWSIGAGAGGEVRVAQECMEHGMPAPDRDSTRRSSLNDGDGEDPAQQLTRALAVAMTSGRPLRQIV